MELLLQPDKIVANGSAFALDGKRVVFIPYGCPGDVLKTKLISEKKDYALADIVEIQKPSPFRIQPPCPYFFDPVKSKKFAKYIFCGGCNLQHVDYKKQLEIKRNIIVDTFKKICRIKEVPCDPVAGMDTPWEYRCKVQLPVGSVKRRVLIGFYKPGSHLITDIESCLIQDPIATKIINVLRPLITQARFAPYNENKHNGNLRHILIRTSLYSRKALVTFITRTENFPKKRDFVDKLIMKIPEISGVYHNINPHKTNVILGRYTRKLWGDAFLEERIGTCKYIIKPTAFFQVNPLQTEKLYNAVKTMSACTGQETVYDLYCGSGGIGIYLADKAKKVIGMDVSEESIQSACRNAEINRLTNCSFRLGDVEKVLYKIMHDKLKNPVIIVDPPRAGCPEKLLNFISRIRSKIVYVSCHPATCARDVSILQNHGYKLKKIVPIDMFPQTAHIELVALLET